MAYSSPCLKSQADKNSICEPREQTYDCQIIQKYVALFQIPDYFICRGIPEGGNRYSTTKLLANCFYY